jgi:hypothetical protein
MCKQILRHSSENERGTKLMLATTNTKVLMQIGAQNAGQ